jgi:hypothetical protein
MTTFLSDPRPFPPLLKKESLAVSFDSAAFVKRWRIGSPACLPVADGEVAHFVTVAIPGASTPLRFTVPDQINELETTLAALNAAHALGRSEIARQVLDVFEKGRRDA